MILLKEGITNEDIRQDFKSRGLSYADIDGYDLHVIKLFINKELLKFNNDGFTMKLRSLRLNDIELKEDGTLKKCHFMVDGFIDGRIHFKRREAISFNSEDKKGFGFIGFAGWADSKNVNPFLVAFQKFARLLVEPKS